MQISQKKKGFTSGIGFILAAAGSSIGLGNLWSFPFKTANYGGGAFVFVYILCVLFIGVIAMMCEIFLGRRASANPVTAFKKANKHLGWVGLLVITCSFLISCYYLVLGGYTAKYSVGSFFGNENFAGFTSNYWLVIGCTALFAIFALIIIIGGIKDGIEKFSKVLMPVLFILLLVVVVISLCQGPGVAEGLQYYLLPDFSKISFKVILAAMGQAFYSLSLGMGAMMVYGSYTGKEVNLGKSTAMICVFDTAVALFAGLAIFPSVFHYAAVAGENLSTLQMDGMSLLFTTLPKVFSSMGVFGMIVSFMFFAMVVIAAVTSVISILEVASQFVIQKFKIKRKVASSIVTLVAFLISIAVAFSIGQLYSGTLTIQILGISLFELLDSLANIVFMPVAAFVICITVGWIIGAKKSAEEIEESGTKLGWFKYVFIVMSKFITPLLILVVEIFGVKDTVFPGGTFSVSGLAIVLIGFGIIAVLVAVYYLLLYKKDTGINADEI